LPTTQTAVRTYLRRRHQGGVKANTISRAFSHIGQIHEALDLPNPCRHRFITAELKALRRIDPPPEQATALRFSDLQRWTETIAHDTRPTTLRNRAMIWLAYDGLLRVSELVAVEVSWLETQADGSALLYLPAAINKNNEDAYLYVTSTTQRYIEAWCQSVEIIEGRLFRSWELNGVLRDSLHPSSANDIIQFVGGQLGLEGVSSHSLRVGADQDLMALGESLVAIMVAGRWKDAKMPAHYGRKVVAAQSATARLAKEQGR
jgi:site-specific recombinase XerD